MGALPCRTKIILDGGGAMGQAQALVEAAKALTPEQTAMLTDEVAYPIIKQVIVAEEALGLATNLLLDAVGYKGPRPGRGDGYASQKA